MKKKYGLVFEEHTEEVDERLQNEIPVLCEDKERRICKDEALPWNFILEGDNLQALYLLEKTHKGRIDCIYIDPPYNTGAKDWKYNNDYVVAVCSIGIKKKKNDATVSVTPLSFSWL